MSLKNPVKYPVKHYSHLDAGAPQTADADGAIKTILKACLVTGYGTKEGAGWTALFDDAFRIVLRRPLRTGNPPDIKIENGIINGVASHRLVSQDNPTGLDDANNLTSVKALFRDRFVGSEWHLVVSDFGFLFTYQMGSYYSTEARNSFLYCGSAQKMRDADVDLFIANTFNSLKDDGTINNSAGFLNSDSVIKDMRQGGIYDQKLYMSMDVPETHFNNDYLAQQIIIQSRMILPFCCSLPSQYDNTPTNIVSISGRSMLRSVNLVKGQYVNPRAFYIPLDSWEL